MELYLESHVLKEIEEAFKSGIPSGLTTSPGFIQRSTISDETALIQKLSSLASVIQIDAIGEKSETIVHEAHRLMSLGISPDSIVLRIPVSMEGIKACRILSKEGIQIKIREMKLIILKIDQKTKEET